MENIPDALLDRVSDSLLGSTTVVQSAVRGRGGGLRLGLRPRRWPQQSDAGEPDPHSVASAQRRVVKDLARDLPLASAEGHTNVLDGQPELCVHLPGPDERWALAAELAGRSAVPRLLGVLALVALAVGGALALGEALDRAGLLPSPA